VISEREVLFSVVQRYGRAPARQQGGLQSSQVVLRGSRDWVELTGLNAGVAPSLGMARGVTHAEFLRAEADGRYLFTEIAAPVCGPWEVEVVEAATGVNLWREWARLEAAQLRGENYLPPESYEMYAGCVQGSGPECEGRLHAQQAKEIVARRSGGADAGILLRAAEAEQISRGIEAACGEAD
jgi:hypothetical protein